MLVMNNETKQVVVVNLVSITKYAKHWGIDRKTAHRLMDIGVLTRYITPDGTPYLALEQKPTGVRAYRDRLKPIK